MESIPGHDRYLDPPDWPTRGQCDLCGEDYDNDDLTRTGPTGCYRWLCNDCLDSISANAEKDDDDEF
jgi:hypothetical protein